MTSLAGRRGSARLVPPAVEAVRALARLARVVEKACTELSLGHYRVLSAIGAGDERASRMAIKLSLGKPTVSASVDALCRRGLVTRSVEASDQRAIRLALTDSGRAVLERVERAMVKDLEQLWGRTADPFAIIDALARLGIAAEALAEEHIRAESTRGVRDAQA